MVVWRRTFGGVQGLELRFFEKFNKKMPLGELNIFGEANILEIRAFIGKFEVRNGRRRF